MFKDSNLIPRPRSKKLSLWRSRDHIFGSLSNYPDAGMEYIDLDCIFRKKDYTVILNFQFLVRLISFCKKKNSPPHKPKFLRCVKTPLPVVIAKMAKNITIFPGLPTMVFYAALYLDFSCRRKSYT